MVEQFSSRETKLVGEEGRKKKRKKKNEVRKAMSFKFVPFITLFF